MKPKGLKAKSPSFLEENEHCPHIYHFFILDSLAVVILLSWLKTQESNFTLGFIAGFSFFLSFFLS